MNVKCLSVRNPLSYLICAGVKDVENRSWQTHYRGDLYIQSSGKYDFFMIRPQDVPPAAMELTKKSPYVKKMAKFLQKIEAYYGNPKIYDDKFLEEFDKRMFLQAGSIVGKVKIVDCIRDSKSPFSYPGEWHWILKDAELFEKPIENVKGRLSIFNVII